MNGKISTTNGQVRYIVRCYTKAGDLDHEANADTLKQAETIRLEWAEKLNIRRFAYMPTIWTEDADGKRTRLLDY